MSDGRRIVLLAIGVVGVALVVVVAQLRPARSPGIGAPEAPTTVAAQDREPLALEAEVARDAIAILTASGEPAAPQTPTSSARAETDHVTLPVGISSSKDKPPSDGWHVTHYPDGALESEGEFRNGKREGLWRSYSEKGILELEGVYERGEATGVWRAWHENAAIRGIATCERGQFHGACQFWTADGKPDPALSGRYEKGVRIE